MRELEERTGVGRETIRDYIRQGLLPAPERTGHDPGSYNHEHVARVRAIKQLQEERSLPLTAIRALLDDEDDERLPAGPFPQLDSMLRARLDIEARLPLARVAAETGCPQADIDDVIANGIISITPDGTVEPRDVTILRMIAELRRIGYTRERGFNGEGLLQYKRVIEALVTEELRRFFIQVADKVDDCEAVDMVERGIAAVNDILTLMRTSEVLGQLAARRRIANDNR